MNSQNLFRFNVPWLEKVVIVASNDINEETLLSLNQQVYTSVLEICFEQEECFMFDFTKAPPYISVWILDA